MPLFLLGVWSWLKDAFSVACEAAKSFFKSLDGQGWVGLAVSLGLTVCVLHFIGEARHWHKQSNRFEALHNAELAHDASIAKQAVDLKNSVDALTSSVTNVLKERADAQNARIAADAAALRLRGPGKATCPGNTVIAGAPVRSEPSASTNAGSPLPADDRAAVPWSWLVNVIEEHDQMRSKLQAVEDQHAQLEKAWPKGTAK